MKTQVKKWRRGWDSNPRYGFPYARFRGEYFQPLSHLSAVIAISIVASVPASSNRGFPKPTAVLKVVVRIRRAARRKASKTEPLCAIKRCTRARLAPL
jgi:hypothetical protein